MCHKSFSYDFSESKTKLFLYSIYILIVIRLIVLQSIYFKYSNTAGPHSNFVQCHFIIRLMRCQENLTLVYIISLGQICFHLMSFQLKLQNLLRSLSKEILYVNLCWPSPTISNESIITVPIASPVSILL